MQVCLRVCETYMLYWRRYQLTYIFVQVSLYLAASLVGFFQNPTLNILWLEQKRCLFLDSDYGFSVAFQIGTTLPRRKSRVSIFPSASFVQTIMNSKGPKKVCNSGSNWFFSWVDPGRHGNTVLPAVFYNHHPITSDSARPSDKDSFSSFGSCSILLVRDAISSTFVASSRVWNLSSKRLSFVSKSISSFLRIWWSLRLAR